jgi:putative Ca2+/H+ antiporter (TMEM165/GDT1 family)
MSEDLIVDGIVIFALIVCFQFPGKSNFGVITLSARHPPKDVWLGSAAGLLAATAVSVGIGLGAVVFLSQYLEWVKVAGGTVLILFGVIELLRSMDAEARKLEEESRAALSPHQVRFLALSLAFFLEMGDNTQILAILFVASTGNPLLVYAAVSLALLTVAAVTAHGGKYLKEHVSPRRLWVILSTIFIVVGSFTIFFALFPGLLPFFG